MYRFSLLSVLLAAVILPGKAQQFPFKLYDTGKVMLRMNPFALLDPVDQNLSVGGEYRFNATWALTLDAAWIFHSTYYRDIKRATGFIVRPGVRAYVGRYKDYFFEFQLHYKNVMYHVEDWLGRDMVNGTPSYEQLTRFRYRRQIAGAQLMGGTRKEIIGNRLYLEFYLGLGLRSKSEGLYHEQNSHYDGPNNSVAADINGNLVPAVPMGLRLVYRIR